MTNFTRHLEEIATKENIDLSQVYSAEEKLLPPAIPVAAGQPEKTDARLYGTHIRTTVILDFESEFNTIVPVGMKWACGNLFFQHNGFAYCHKPSLVQNLQEDAEMLKVAKSNKTTEAELFHFQNVFGIDNLDGPLILDDIRNILHSNSPGLPKLIKETPTFFQFEDFIGDAITIDDITYDLLTEIKHTFTGKYGPYFTNINDGLFRKDGKLIFANLPIILPVPINLFGILIQSKTLSSKYPKAKTHSHFFTDTVLTDAQFSAAIKYSEFETESPATVITLKKE